MSILTLLVVYFGLENELITNHYNACAKMDSLKKNKEISFEMKCSNSATDDIITNIFYLCLITRFDFDRRKNFRENS